MKLVKAYSLPLLTTGILFALLAGWVRYELNRQERAAFAYLKQTANAILTAMEGAIQVDARGGVMRRGRLKMIMEGVISQTNIEYIALVQGKKTLISAGSASDLPVCGKGKGEQLMPGRLFCWREIGVQNCSHGTEHSSASGKGRGGNGRGQGRHNSSPKQPTKAAVDTLHFAGEQQFLVAFNDESYRAQVMDAERHMTIISAIAGLAIVGLTSLWIFSIRGQSLKNKLQVAHERMERFKEFELAAFGLAHEARHPLGLIRATAQQIATADGVTDGQKTRAIEIIEETDVATSRLGEFMNYARLKEPDIQDVNAKELCDSLAGLLTPDFTGKSVGLTVNSEADMILKADRDMLQRVIINLLMNSLNACGVGAEVMLSVGMQGDSAELTVKDTGCGIPDNLSDTVFQPYVTGREGGHGIGLAMVKKIADEHGWEIAMQTVPQSGTTMTISGITLSSHGDVNE